MCRLHILHTYQQLTCYEIICVFSNSPADWKSDFMELFHRLSFRGSLLFPFSNSPTDWKSDFMESSIGHNLGSLLFPCHFPVLGQFGGSTRSMTSLSKFFSSFRVHYLRVSASCGVPIKIPLVSCIST